MSDCERYERIISMQIDGEAGAADLADLEKHLAECPACRAWQAKQLRLDAGLSRALGEWRESLRPAPPARRPRPFALAAAALSLASDGDYVTSLSYIAYLERVGEKDVPPLPPGKVDCALLPRSGREKRFPAPEQRGYLQRSRFGDHLATEGGGHTQYTFQDGQIVRVIEHVADKRTVNLETACRQVFQVCER